MKFLVITSTILSLLICLLFITNNSSNKIASKNYLSTVNNFIINKLGSTSKFDGTAQILSKEICQIKGQILTSKSLKEVPNNEFEVHLLKSSAVSYFTKYSKKLYSITGAYTNKIPLDKNLLDKITMSTITQQGKFEFKNTLCEPVLICPGSSTNKPLDKKSFLFNSINWTPCLWIIPENKSDSILTLYIEK